MIELNKYGTIKTKVYSFNCIIKGDSWQSIIIITYNKYIFFTNNEAQRA